MVSRALIFVSMIAKENEMKSEMFETINSAGEYTGLYRALIADLAFALPGRGGRTTKKAFRALCAAWAAGRTAQECADAAGAELL